MLIRNIRIFCFIITVDFILLQPIYAQLLKKGAEVQIQPEIESKGSPILVLGYNKIKGEETFYPRIKEFREKNVFYDCGGYQILSLDGKDGRFMESPPENFLGVYKYLDVNAGQLQFIVYKNDGTKLWEYSYSQTQEDNIYFRVSEKGAAVKLIVHETELEFFNEYGELLKSVKIFDDPVWGFGRNFFGQYSKDGNYFFVIAENELGDKFREKSSEKNEPENPVSPIKLKGSIPSPKEDSNKKVPSPLPKLSGTETGVPVNLNKGKSVKKRLASENFALILFDEEGNELWRQYSHLLFPINFGITDNGDYIITILRDHEYKDKPMHYGIFLYNKHGESICEIMREYETGKGIPMDFKYQFNNDNTLCAIANANWLLLFETETCKILWEKQFPWETQTRFSNSIRTIRQLAFLSNQGKWFLVIESIGENKKGRNWRNLQPQFILINESGEIHNQHQFDLGSGVGWGNGFQINAYGDKVLFDWGSKIYSFNL